MDLGCLLNDGSQLSGKEGFSPPSFHNTMSVHSDQGPDLGVSVQSLFKSLHGQDEQILYLTFMVLLSNRWGKK